MSVLMRLLFCLIVAAVPFAARTIHSAEEEAIASLDPVQGLIQHQTVQDDPTDPASWETVTERILIAEGDRIRTGSDGLAYLTFFEGIESEIEPDTLVVVSTLDLPDEADPSFDLSMDVLVGSTMTNLDAALDTNDRFEIHTPSATAAVRGTRWWTVVKPDGTATFNTERGKVQIFAHPPRIISEGAAFIPAPAPANSEGASAANVLPEPENLVAGMSLMADRSGVISRLEQFTPPQRPRAAAIAERTCGDGICRPRERVTCPVDCAAALPTCGNGICDVGEGLLTCGVDCGPYQGVTCGDGVCDSDESGLTCPADCQPDQYFSPVEPTLCGNGTCDTTESALTCAADCEKAAETE